MKIETRIDSKGRFFGPAGPMELNRFANVAIKELVSLGEEMLLRSLTRKPGGVFLTAQEARPGQASVGTYRGTLKTKFSNLSGMVYDPGSVKYGPWLEGTSSRNAISRFKGYAQFEKTKQKIDEKSKEIFRKILRRYVAKMNS